MAGIYVNIEASRSPKANTSSAGRSAIGYTRAICKELSYYAPTLGQNETIEAIFLGGQPESLSEDGIRSIVASIFSNFDAVQVNEMAIDLMPGQYNLDSLQGLAALGFNTACIQTTSFFESDLGNLSLTHTPEDTASLVTTCRQAGFSRISISLDIGIPEQPHEYWAANLEKALSLDIQHISFCGMPVFNHQTLQPQLAGCFSYPDDEHFEKFELAAEYLRRAGLEHYTLSAFAKPGFEQKQRMLQLFHGNILGIGPAAHSFWWQEGSHSQANRWANVDNIAQYKALINQKELPVDSRSALDLDTLANEYTMLRVQHPDGLDLIKLETEYGVDLLTERLDELAWLEAEGFIEPIRNHVVKLSPLGKIHGGRSIGRLMV